jgi:hypothetical protein
MLNEEQRALAIARLDADAVVKVSGRKERTTLRLVIRSLNFNVGCIFIKFGAMIEQLLP